MCPARRTGALQESARPRPMTAHLTAIGTATPSHDIHRAFVGWAAPRLDDRTRRVFDRMVERAEIAHRWSVLPETAQGGSPVSSGGFYAGAVLPGTAARMALYAEAAPALALAAVANLGETFDPAEITHLVVASCTGFVAPGIDQILAARLGLRGNVERLLIGFMGCYAAVTALKSARHIVRSQPEACVLVVTVELSTLHLQDETEIEPLLAMLQFGDGAAAGIVKNATLIRDHRGLFLGEGFAATLPDSSDLIRWNITDNGFAMHLSGEVPRRIAGAIGTMKMPGVRDPKAVAHWAVHAGGRSILDAVAHGLELAPDALADSRAVLRANGNMSSATLMFVLARLIDRGVTGPGVALAFGPGLAAEGFVFGPPA